jgi:hypothetical protein
MRALREGTSFTPFEEDSDTTEPDAEVEPAREAGYS